MVREIKFRAKRIDNGQWIYGQYFKTPLTDENSGTSPEVGWFFLSGETRHCIVQDGVSFVIDVKTLGQYTELKDCEYKDVFEGDICELRTGYGLYGSLGIVGFELGEFFFTNLGEGLYGEFKIIGNIYENPELLQDI